MFRQLIVRSSVSLVSLARSISSTPVSSLLPSTRFLSESSEPLPISSSFTQPSHSVQPSAIDLLQAQGNLRYSFETVDGTTTCQMYLGERKVGQGQGQEVAQAISSAANDSCGNLNLHPVQ